MEQNLNNKLPLSVALTTLTMEVTWRRALEVWWSIFWRWAGAAFLGGILIAVTVSPLGLSTTARGIVIQLLSFVLGPLIGIWAIRSVLRKESPWSDFRIGLLPISARPDG